MDNNGWKVDEHGKRYREIAPGHIEFEPTIVVDGIEIYQSDLEEFQRRQKAAEERRKAAALEEFKNRPEPKGCPWSTGMDNQCKREKCALFFDGRCSIAIIADAHGADHPIEKGTKCPFSIYSRCDRCALNNGGCAIVRIAAVNK